MDLITKFSEEDPIIIFAFFSHLVPEDNVRDGRCTTNGMLSAHINQKTVVQEVYHHGRKECTICYART